MVEKRNKEIYKNLAMFFIPFIIAGFVLLGLYLLIDNESSGKLFILMFAYFFPPLGKESIIPLGIGGGKNLNIPIINEVVTIPEIDPLVMALTIAFVDIIIALFLLWNYDLAKKIPLIGTFMDKIENIGKSSSDKYRWIKPLRFIGIILFVMVPFQGSGGLVGTIVGRLIGMKPLNTFFAISIGSITGCILIAYFADAILSVFVKNIMYGLLIIIILIIIGFMIYFIRKNRNQKNNNKNE
jgi:uncharacterized membrane protein